MLHQADSLIAILRSLIYSLVFYHSPEYRRNRNRNLSRRCLHKWLFSLLRMWQTPPPCPSTSPPTWYYPTLVPSSIATMRTQRRPLLPRHLHPLPSIADRMTLRLTAQCSTSTYRPQTVQKFFARARNHLVRLEDSTAVSSPPWTHCLCRSRPTLPLPLKLYLQDLDLDLRGESVTARCCLSANT